MVSGLFAITMKQPFRLVFQRDSPLNDGTADILSYIHNLFDLCDTWAREELKATPPDSNVDLMTEITLNAPPKNHKIKLRDVLQLIQIA